MSANVCVNCRNEKPVNLTTNRLVTESCGHVKCMDCLLHETSGCVACLSIGNPELEQIAQNNETDGNEAQTNLLNIEDDDVNRDELVCEDLSKKRKPETSHIKVEIDAKGVRCYICTLCDKKFHARSQVAYHAYCNGQKKPFHCDECKKSFATHSHFKYHMRVHRNERTYACEVCGDSFFQMSKLQRHKLKHTKEKKHVCNQCNKAFNNLTSLRKHGLTHTEERPYECSTCGRRFRDGSNYRKHVDKHNVDKKYQSGPCGPQRRPYQCPRCPQAFQSGKDMRRHVAVHSDSKPFRCKVCDRRFRRKDNLERHIRNTHPDYVTSSAVECDETALRQIITPTPPAPPTNGDEKTKLENMNPLPPLSEEVIQKHMHGDTEVDKSYILVANNARQSVIVGKWTAKVDRDTSPPVCEYVHKIRRANSMASQNNITLPPIDEKKMVELKKKSLDTFDVGAPPKDKKKLYEMILYDDGDKRDTDDASADSNSDNLWKRRKMKLV